MRFLAVVITCAIPGAGASAEYLRDVKPILAEKCYVCHGAAQQMGGLRLDTKVQRQAAVAGGFESGFVKRITSKESSTQMPPWPSALGTSPQEIEILKGWAAEGAPGDDPAPLDTPTSNLLAAVDQGDTARVRALLKDRRLVNARDRDGASILMHAVLNADINCVKFLLQQGANPNVRNYEGATALIWASDDLAKVRLLLAAGAEVNAQTKHGGTALLAASLCLGSSPVIAELLRHGASVNATDTDGWTPLIRAAASGDAETVKQLLAHGSDPNRPSTALTALTSAVWYGNADIVKLLIHRGVPVDSKDGVGFTALSLAALWDRKEIAAELLDRGAGVNMPIAETSFMRRSPGTPLMLAAYTETQDVDLIKLLIAREADIHFATSAKETAATRAGTKGDSPVLAAGDGSRAGRRAGISI